MNPPADVVLLVLGRQDFTRLLGPLQRLLESQAATYTAPNAKITKVGAGGWWLIKVALFLVPQTAGWYLA